MMEEKLELRGDDGRVSAFLRSITDPGALADSSGYSPDLSFEQKVQLLEELDVVERLRLALAAQRDALAETQIRRRIRDDVESGAQKQQREYLLRKQMESIRKELGDDDASVVEEYRAKIEEAGMPETVKEQAERELGRLERLGDGNAESSVIRSYLDWLIAVPWSAAQRGAARPGARPRGAGRRSRRPRGRQGPDHRVPGRAQAAQGPGGRRGQALRRDPHPDRPSRHRQDLDRRVDRPRHRPRVRADVAGRRPRRGGDPRPSPHLHRRDAGPPGARTARRRHDEPGDHAGRGRQGRRRLARRPVVGAAGGARPRAEPLVPRSLPGRRARPVRGAVHRHGQRRRLDPRPAARPDGSHPLRRLHGGREGRDRPWLPVAPPGRAKRPAGGRGDDLRRRAEDDRQRVHPRGGRAAARARAGHGAAQDGDPDRVRHRRGAGRGRHGGGPRRTGQAALLPGGGDPHGGARSGNRPGGHRHRWRRAVRRGDVGARAAAASS